MDTEAYHPPALSWTSEALAESAANTVAEQRALEREMKAVDPEGILTGKEALKLAKAFKAEAWSIEGELIAGSCVHDSACEADLETDAELLGKASEELETCYESVHSGRWKNGVYQTGVCYFHYTDKSEWGHTIVNLFETEACWLRPEFGDSQAWYCKHHGGWEFT
jgi:hypothetical protein